MRFARWILLGTLASSSAQWVSGHELELSVRLSAPAAIVRAAYGGSQPAQFAKVQVFTPGTNQQLFLSGTTDRRGFFSFVPDQGGAWRVKVDDEEGHRRDIVVQVPGIFQSSAVTVAQGPPRLERALVGLALIFGITGFWYGFRARRRV